MEKIHQSKLQLFCVVLVIPFLINLGIGFAEEPPIKIGFMTGFTGPGATISKRLFQGTELAVEEINANGGIMGRKIELIVRDDQTNPTRGLTLAKQLIEKEKIEAMIGPSLTGTCVATTPVFSEAKILQLISGTGVPLDANKFPYLFRVAFGTEEQAQIMVDYIIDYLKKPKIGLVGDSTALGRNGAKDITKILKKRGMKPVGAEFFNAGDLDMTSQLRKLRDNGAEVIILYAVGPDLANVLKARKSIGWDVPVVGHIALALKGTLDLIGPELAENVYSIMDKPFTISDEVKLSDKIENFREKLIKKIGKINDTLFLQAVYYDPVYVYKYAVEKAGSTDSDKLKAILENTRDYEALQGTIRFSPDNHNGIWPEDMTVIEIKTLENGIHQKAPFAP